MNLIRVACGAIILSSMATCRKQDARKASDQDLILSAQRFVNASILSEDRAPVSANYRMAQPKSISWDQAVVLNLTFGKVVVAPVRFDSSVYVSTALDGNRPMELRQLTKVIVTTDLAGRESYQVNTFIPDSVFLGGSPLFSGIILTEDWFGNSLRQPIVLAARNPVEKVLDELEMVESCETIDGYNYSVDDPENGETWSETSCSTYGIEDGGGVGLGAEDAASAMGGGGSGSTSFNLLPPTNVIGNYQDYIKCFTNVGGTDHTYTVILAVEQPVPGTRTPWVSNGGGGTTGGGPVSAGHTFLVLSETTAYGTTTRNVGFYPQGLISPLSPSDQGVLNNDQATGYNIALSISVTNAQFFTVLNFLGQGNTPGFLYNLNSNNCTTFALNALASTGIDITTTRGTWLDGSGDDPGDLGEDIRSMQLPANMTRNTVGSPHPNLGSCQ